MRRFRFLTPSELNEPEWWCNHHKQSVQWLVWRIEQYFSSEGLQKQQIEDIIKASLPAFAESVRDPYEVKEP